MIRHFLFDICNCQKNWTMKSFCDGAVAQIKAAVGDKKVIMGLSGGVDSSVAASLIHKAIGKNLLCIFVDNGLLRKNEKETLENITNARSNAMGADSISDKSSAEGALSGSISKFMLVVENYPDLKANANFISLQEELSSTENKIAFSRQNYNDQVLFFNNKIEMFPSNIIAGSFNFKQADFFEIEDKTERDVPKVKF